MNKKQPDARPEVSLSLFEDAIPLFQVLADLNRQRIIVEIAKHERLNVNQIDEKIELSRPAISHHLKLLRQAGIERNRSGTGRTVQQTRLACRRDDAKT